MNLFTTKKRLIDLEKEKHITSGEVWSLGSTYTHCWI